MMKFRHCKAPCILQIVYALKVLISVLFCSQVEHRASPKAAEGVRLNWENYIQKTYIHSSEAGIHNR